MYLIYIYYRVMMRLEDLEVSFFNEKGIFMKKRFLGNKGFSLVELIIVIAIMAILAGAIAPSVIRYIRKARASRATEELRTIVTAVETGLISSYADDYDINADKVYTDSSGGTHACGVMTNWMLSRAQNDSTGEITDANKLEYYFAEQVLIELNAEDGSNFSFFNFTGDEDDPLGYNCDAFSSQYGCPGVIVAYSAQGKVLFAQYYNYGCLIEYSSGNGYYLIEDDTFVGAPTIQ